MFLLDDISDHLGIQPSRMTMGAYTVTVPDGRLGGATWEIGSELPPSREEVLIHLNELVRRDGMDAVVSRLTSAYGLKLDQ